MNETKTCPYCGEEIMAGARKCKHCGEWLDDVITNAPSNSQPAIGTRPVTVMTRPSEQSVNQPIVINNTVQRSNGIGTAGFIFALISAIFSWVPGVILSIIDVIILVAVVGAVASIF